MKLEIWNHIKLVCGNHKEEYPEMYLHEGASGRSVFYVCPCYISPLNQQIGDRSCNNRLSIIEMEHMINKLDNELFDKLLPIENNLTGFKWNKNGIYYEVLNHKNKDYIVSVLNKKAMAK